MGFEDEARARFRAEHGMDEGPDRTPDPPPEGEELAGLDYADAVMEAVEVTGLEEPAGEVDSPKLPDEPNPFDDPRVTAMLDMLERTGIRKFQLRYEDSDEPVVWMALALHLLDGDGRPVAEGGRPSWRVAASLHPVGAVFELLEALIDGGTCRHCSRPTGITLDHDGMPLDALFCWYAYDPELSTFRRGCEDPDGR